MRRKFFDIRTDNDDGHEPEEIDVYLHESDLQKFSLHIALEGRWIASGYKDWMYRLDPAIPEMKILRHVHISRKKHTSAKSEQASWNEDGTRHDRRSFNENTAKINAVRTIVYSVLIKDSGISLESYQTRDPGEISFSSDESVACIRL